MQRGKNKNTWKGLTEKMRAEHRSKELGTPGKQHEGQRGAGTNTRWSVEGSAAGNTEWNEDKDGGYCRNYSNATKRKEWSFDQVLGGRV